MHNMLNFDVVKVKVGKVVSTAANAKWRALRLVLKHEGGLVRFRTLVRNYFDANNIDEKRVTTRQPSGVKLY